MRVFCNNTPVEANAPGSHGAHEVEFVDGASEPTGQGVHTIEARLSVYVPAGQACRHFANAK